MEHRDDAFVLGTIGDGDGVELVSPLLRDMLSDKPIGGLLSEAEARKASGAAKGKGKMPVAAKKVYSGSDDF